MITEITIKKDLTLIVAMIIGMSDLAFSIRNSVPLVKEAMISKTSNVFHVVAMRQTCIYFVGLVLMKPKSVKEYHYVQTRKT